MKTKVNYSRTVEFLRPPSDTENENSSVSVMNNCKIKKSMNIYKETTLWIILQQYAYKCQEKMNQNEDRWPVEAFT